MTYTFTDELGQTVIDTCRYDVFGEPFFDDLDAVFDSGGSCEASLTAAGPLGTCR